jgi:hypothetical protein
LGNQSGPSGGDVPVGTPEVPADQDLERSTLIWVLYSRRLASIALISKVKF